MRFPALWLKMWFSARSAGHARTLAQEWRPRPAQTGKWTEKWKDLSHTPLTRCGFWSPYVASGKLLLQMFATGANRKVERKVERFVAQPFTGCGFWLTFAASAPKCFDFVLTFAADLAHTSLTRCGHWFVDVASGWLFEAKAHKCLEFVLALLRLLPPARPKIRGARGSPSDSPAPCMVNTREAIVRNFAPLHAGSSAFKQRPRGVVATEVLDSGNSVLASLPCQEQRLRS